MNPSVFLVVLFLIDGEPSVIDGWLPRQQPNMSICEQRSDSLNSYFLNNPEAAPLKRPVAAVGCVEALDMFEAAQMMQGRTGEAL